MAQKKNFFRFMSLDNQAKNWFDMSHTNSGSCNMGQLVPVLCEPTLPDDYHVLNLSYLVRMAQMVAPPMTRIGIHFFAFDVPNRILMDSRQWDKFLADVDGTSGVSLPIISMGDILSYFRTYIIENLPDAQTIVGMWNTYISEYTGTDYSIESPTSNITTGGRTFVFTDSSIKPNSYYPSDLPESMYLVNGTDLRSYGSLVTIGNLFYYWYKAIFKEYPLVGSLLDYLGMPVNSPFFSTDSMFAYSSDSTSISISVVSPTASYRSIQVLPMLAYLYIWNEYFRQEFIQEEIPEELLTTFNQFKTSEGFDIGLLFNLKRRDWEHDYFTSCLPSTQLGEQASIEIGSDGFFTIPELREANVIQKIREKLLHGGSRVWEILANFFGSNVSDSRIQIPQFIRPEKYADGHAWLRISDIYQTAPGASDSFPTLSADANIAAPRGASVNTSNQILSFKHKCKEHGYIIVLMNIQPEPVYSQGIPRHFLSLDTLDLGWPDFANITEQPVYQYEIYTTGSNTLPSTISGGNPSEQIVDDYPIFGYQSQYAWYKFHNSELHGELRNDLDFFHFGRIFESEPYLNDEFLQCNPSDRPFPIEYEYDKITYHLAFDYNIERKLPYFGVPSLR